MNTRLVTVLAAAALAGTPFVVSGATPSATPTPSPQAQPAQQHRDAREGVARSTSPTWKVFSTTVGRGTAITVSTGGNITSYLSPNQTGAKYEHIGVGTVGEGYVLCYSGLSGSAYDLGDLASGFAAPTTTSNAVTRRTSDNRIELTQSYAFTVGSNTNVSNLLVTMKLRNLTASPISGVVLRRQVDFDIDTGGPQGWAGFLSNHARTKATVSAFHDPVEAPAGAEAHGITLGSQTTPGPFESLVTQDILDPGCAPAQAPQSPDYFVSRGDYGDSISYAVGTIKPGATKTAAVRYYRF
jgi:hypothetical protein